MRDLIISIICILILIVPWSIYSGYTSNAMNIYNASIDDRLIPSITSSDWDTAEKEFNIVSEKWDKHKKISAYFISTNDINEIDGTMSKVFYYIKMHDESNASGEVAYLKCKLNLLYENDRVSSPNLL